MGGAKWANFPKRLLSKHGKGLAKNASAQEPRMGIAVDAINCFINGVEEIGAAQVAGKLTV